MKIQYSLRNIFFLISAISCVLATELGIGMFSFLIDAFPLELAMVIGPFFAVTANLMFFAPRKPQDSLLDFKEVEQIQTWILSSFSVVTFGLVISLMMRWEFNGRYSPLSNAISLLQAAAWEAAMATLAFTVLRIHHGSNFGFRFVYLTLMVFAASILLMILVIIVA